MIRKAVIVMLMLASFASGLAIILSYQVFSLGWHDGRRNVAYEVIFSGRGFVRLVQWSGARDYSFDDGVNAHVYQIGDHALLFTDWGANFSGRRVGGSFTDVHGWQLGGISGALILLPVYSLVRGPLRRYRRSRRGLCVTCGYDLTGNVSGVCPECATEITQP